MRIAGWTLFVMAVLVHFSACEWALKSGSKSNSRILPFLPFVHAREHFAIYRQRTYPAWGGGQNTHTTITYNTTGAGLWGLVIPFGLATAGIGLVLRDPRPTILRRVAGWLRTTGQLLRKTAKSLVRKVLSIWGLLLLVAVLGSVLLLIAPRPDNSNPMAEELGPERELAEPSQSARPIEVEVKGWGVVEFPAGTPRDVMQKALRARFRPGQEARDAKRRGR